MPFDSGTGMQKHCGNFEWRGQFGGTARTFPQRWEKKRDV
jgi:hypothetical protein